MQKEHKNGNKIIQSIMSLHTTESDIKVIKNHIKAYEITIQYRLHASANRITLSSTLTTTSVTLYNNIKEIQVKLDKMKAFAKTTKE